MNQRSKGRTGSETRPDPDVTGRLKGLIFGGAAPESLHDVSRSHLQDVEIPLDGAALWLAQSSLEELQALHPYNLDARYVKRHIHFGLVQDESEDLVRVQSLSKNEIARTKFGQGRQKIFLKDFWTGMGLLRPHPIPHGTLEAWVKEDSFRFLELPRREDYSASKIQEFAHDRDFVILRRYSFLVRQPFELVTAYLTHWCRER